MRGFWLTLRNALVLADLMEYEPGCNAASSGASANLLAACSHFTAAPSVLRQQPPDRYYLAPCSKKNCL